MSETPTIPDATYQPEPLTQAELLQRHELVVLDQLALERPTIDEYELRRIERVIRSPAEDVEFDFQRLKSGRNGGKYQEYTSALRRIRAEQAGSPYVAERLDTAMAAEDPVERRALYLDAVSFSPGVSERVLRRLDRDSARGSGRKKLFTNEKVIEAAQTPELFEQAVTQALISNPRVVLNSIKLVEKLVSAEQTKEAVTILAEDHFSKQELSKRLSWVLNLYQPDERRAVIDKLSNNNEDNFLLDLLKSETASLMSEDEKREVAQQIFKREGVLPQPTAINMGLQQGIWTLQEVEERITWLASHEPGKFYLQLVGDVEGISKKTIDQVKQSLVKKFIAEGSLSLIQGNRLSEGLLDDDDKRTIIEARYAAEPLRTLTTCNELIETLYPPEKAEELYKDYLSSAENKYENPYAMLVGKLSDVDKAQYVRDLATNDPAGLLGLVNMESTREMTEALVGEADVTEYIKSALKRVSFDEIRLHILTYEDYFESDEALKEFIVNGQRKSVSFDLLTDIKSNPASRTAKLFSDEEVTAMLDGTVELFLEPDNISEFSFWSSLGMTEFVNAFGEAKLKEIVQKFADKDIEKCFDIIDKSAYLFTQEELDSYIVKVNQTPSGQRDFLDTIGDWDSSLAVSASPEVIKKYVLSAGSENFGRIVESKSLERFLDSKEITDLMTRILKSNPAMALFAPEPFEKSGLEIDADTVIHDALADTRKTAVIGRYLQENFERLQKTKKESTKNRLLLDAVNVYTTLGAVEEAGGYDELLKLRTQDSLKPTQEQRLVESMRMVQVLEATSQLESVHSATELDQLVIRTVATRLGVEELSSESAQRVINRLGTPNSLALYFNQFAESDEHTAVLKPMLASLADNTYEDWRTGENTPDALESLKSKGLVPSKMSLEQIAQWRKEEATDYQESFNLEAVTAVADVRRILQDHVAELPDDAVVNPSEAAAVAHDLAEELRDLGTQIGALQKELGLLRKQPDQNMAKEQIDEISYELHQIQQESRELQLRQDVALLISMTEDAFANGAIVTQQGEKGRPIAQVLQRLSKNLGTDRAHISGRVHTVFDSYYSQTGEAQDIDVIDTVDPRITLEIGEIPVVSCQNYRNGEYNECLLGYTDPNTKILLLRSKNGNPIARAVFRVLEQEDGSPALHVETLYTSLSGDAVAKSMYRHALAKSERMGVPLFVSTGSQRVSGIQQTPVKNAKLTSKGSRAPFVYVDSAGGSEEGGKYEISGLMQLTRSA